MGEFANLLLLVKNKLIVWERMREKRGREWVGDYLYVLLVSQAITIKGWGRLGGGG